MGISLGLKKAVAFFFKNLGCVFRMISLLEMVDFDRLVALNSAMRLGAASKTRNITL